jgi:hypothetical protein
MKETPITAADIAEFTRTNMVFGRNEDGELILTGLNCDLIGNHEGYHLWLLTGVFAWAITLGITCGLSLR